MYRVGTGASVASSTNENLQIVSKGCMIFMPFRLQIYYKSLNRANYCITK